MLAIQLNHLITDGKLENFTIIRVNKFVVNEVATKATTGKEQRKIVILLDVEPVVPVCFGLVVFAHFFLI